MMSCRVEFPIFDAAGQQAHQEMISEIGTQIDMLQDKMEGNLREQNDEHQQQITEVVASQDEKLADLEAKLYSLGNGVADLEQSANAQVDEIRADGEPSSTYC